MRISQATDGDETGEGSRAPESVVVAEAPSGVILFSSLAASFVGRRIGELVEMEDDELAELGALSIFHPDGRPYHPSEWPLARSLASGEVVVDEPFFRFAEDGSRLAFRASAYPVYDEDGRLAAAVTVARDVTAEEQAETDRAHHASLLQNVDDAVVGTDPDFRLTVWNHAAERLYGFAADEVLGRPVRDVATYAGDRYRLDLERELEETGRTRTEVTARRKDGTTVEVELVSVAVRDTDGEITGYLGIHRDITERKRLAAERARRAHQQSLVASLGLRALTGSDLQAVLDEAVAAVADGVQVLPVGIGEILPGSDELVLRAGIGFHEGAVGTAKGPVSRRSLMGYVVTAGEPVVSEDVEADARFEMTGFLREYAVTSTVGVVIPGRREPFGALGVFSQTPRSFSAGDVNFLQAVANVVSAALERAQSENLIVEVRDAERRRMARDLHDEVLQDLTDALAQASAAQSAAGEGAPDERLARLVTALKRAGRQLRAAIHDLQLDSGESRSIRELLEELVKVQREFEPETRIELEVDEQVPVGALGRIGTEVLRIVGEAIVNARRHSAASTIAIRVWCEEDELLVDVADDGRGFDAAATPATASTGMTSMRERAELLQGELTVDTADRGTTVHLSVPLEAGVDVSARRARVLLVEDHAAVREALAAMLTRAAEFDVVGQAGSLAEARLMLVDVDVAVVDLRLPDGFGGDLIRELREVNPRAQALVLSAGLDRVEMARAIESGAAGTLDKSAGFDELVGALRRLLAGETLVPLDDVVDLLRLAARERDREREDRHAIESLTPREREVLQLLAEGLGSQDIANRLHITLRTERNHVASVLAKLGVHSQLQALVFALRYGVVQVR